MNDLLAIILPQNRQMLCIAGVINTNICLIFASIKLRIKPIYNVINNETLVSIVIINFYDYLIYDFPLGCASPSKWEL